MPATSKYHITGRADTSAIDKTSQSLKGLEGVASSVGKALAGGLAAAASIEGLRRLTTAAMDAAKEFESANQKYRVLALSFAQNYSEYTRATDLINKLASTTLASKDSIEQMVSTLAATGKSVDEIEKLSNAAVILSNVTGKDLNSALNTLMGTFNGQSRELEKLFPEIKGLTDEQLRNGEAVNILNSRYSDFSGNIGSTYTQSIKNLSESWGDLKQAVGGFTADFFAPLLNGLNSLISKWAEALSQAKAYQDAVKLINSGSAVSETDLRKALDAIREEKSIANTKIEGYNKNIARANQMGDVTGAMMLEDAKKIFVDKLSKLEAEERLLNQKLRDLLIEQSNANKKAEAAQQAAAARLTPQKVTADFDQLALYQMGQVFNVAMLDAQNQWFDATLDPILIDYYAQLAERQSQPDIGDFSVMPDMSWLSMLKDTVGGAVDSFISLITSMQPFQMLINWGSTILKGFFSVAEPIVNSLLRPLVGILYIVGQTLGKMLAPVLQALTPVIELISKAFVFLYNYAIAPLANAIVWVISTIYNLIANMVNAVINALNNIPFVDIKWRMGTLDYNTMKLNPISESDLDTAGAQAGVGYAGGGAAASYTGGQNITNNFYIDIATINGTNREAALAFLEEIKQAIKLGLASY